MRRFTVRLVTMALVLIVVGIIAGATMQTPPVEATTASQTTASAVGSVLDRLHASAAKPDATTYFALFAKDAIFLGTDATERWTLEQFKAFAMPLFEKGKGWTYTARDRHVHVASDGRVAWFDELLDNATYGECRGTGVLVRKSASAPWLIAQYNLTKVVPNDRMKAVVEAINATAAPSK